MIAMGRLVSLKEYWKLVMMNEVIYRVGRGVVEC